MFLPFDCVIPLLGIPLKEITWEVDDYQRWMQTDAYYSIIYNSETL